VDDFIGIRTLANRSQSSLLIAGAFRKALRLIFRLRTDWNPSLLNTLVYRGIVEPISFVMGRKMLLNIKQRAESLAGQGAA
jgi:hypothetical protein